MYGLFKESLITLNCEYKKINVISMLQTESESIIAVVLPAVETNSIFTIKGILFNYTEYQSTLQSMVLKKESYFSSSIS